MPTCSICYECFSSPVALPCGHVFCQECIRQVVDSANSSKTKHSCPTCRSNFTIMNLDPNLIPPYLRPHILPTLRPLFIDGLGIKTSPASSDCSMPAASPSNPDVTALQTSVTAWQKQAETHASANTTLLAFARRTRDCALRLRTERDMHRNECVLLKRKLREIYEAQNAAPAAQPKQQPPPQQTASSSCVTWTRKCHEEADTLNSPSPFAPPGPPRSVCSNSSASSSSHTDDLDSDEEFDYERRRRLAASTAARVVRPPVYLLQFEAPNAVKPIAEDALVGGPPMKRRKGTPAPAGRMGGNGQMEVEQERCSVRSISDLLV
ncbi:hypothetical protein FB45DRAFT_828940 [Roridomyces roridus]|uniref:RING-type domain-containing protein n=1 Tax=Roridomyces roridus TaxID=1738132 RepID=A0AAD7C1U5_9AGAR|nr:hypothetical protein FB45DRAFT_828940 [Roridomyces roridus]